MKIMLKLKILLSLSLFLCFNPLSIFAKANYYHQLGPNTPIAGDGYATQSQMREFIAKRNKKLDSDVLSYIVKMYVVESRREGINYDLAFAQMALETNYLRFGNDVNHNQNNFAGLGVINSGVKGHEFDTIYLGIRVHIQHLAAYALKSPLNQEVIDPRFKFVKRGSAPLLKDLTGKWAADPKYDQKIQKLLVSLFKV